MVDSNSSSSSLESRFLGRDNQNTPDHMNTNADPGRNTGSVSIDPSLMVIRPMVPIQPHTQTLTNDSAVSSEVNATQGALPLTLTRTVTNSPIPPPTLPPPRVLPWGINVAHPTIQPTVAQPTHPQAPPVAPAVPQPLALAPSRPQPSADFQAAINRQIVPGGPTAYTVPRRQGAGGANDVTSFHPGQAYWNLENLPNIIYRFKPAIQDRVAWYYPRPDQKQDANGNLMWDPKYPQDDMSGRPIYDFEILPDRIGTAEQEWYFEAIRRLDQRVEWKDILARMQPDHRPAPNTLNMRCLRFRQKYCMGCWDPRGRFSESKEGEDIIHKLTPQQKQNNTTRGTTPGLRNPALGEATGNRIPTPQQRNPFLSVQRPRKSKTLTPKKRDASEGEEPEGESEQEATPVKRKRLDRAEHKKLREISDRVKAGSQSKHSEGFDDINMKMVKVEQNVEDEEHEDHEREKHDHEPEEETITDLATTPRYLAPGPHYRYHAENQAMLDHLVPAPGSIPLLQPPPPVRQRAPHEYHWVAPNNRINDVEFQRWLNTRGMIVFSNTLLGVMPYSAYRVSDMAWNDFFGIPR
ncbi:MAG: hypothetical protein M1812_003739 [Candelaria pacifica]|nr:MAG: hypothetical protein M1812_003739 [Candelaria pacifica]